MYTKTGLSFLAAAGLAVGVAGMTMGGASAASPTCVPSGTANQGATAPARNASSSNSTANRNASAAPTGAMGPAGPQGADGTNGSNGGNGTTPSGDDGTGVTGPTGATGSTGSNGRHGIRIVANTDPNADQVNGVASVTDYDGTVPTSSGSQSLLNVRARSNAVNPSGGTTSAPSTSGTHVTARSSLTGSQPIVDLTPGR